MNKTNPPTPEDYTDSVQECASKAVDQYDPQKDDAEDITFSETLPQIIRSVINDSKWINEKRGPLTVYYSEQSPSQPTHTAGLRNVINLKSEPEWNEIVGEAAYICFFSDVYVEAENMIQEQQTD